MITPLRVTPAARTAFPQLPTPPDWTRHAACRDWPELDWIDPAPEHEGRCRAICADCPVRRKCLATALTAGEPWGIWGGLNVDERACHARQNGYPPPNVRPHHGVHARYIRHGCRCDACRYAHALYTRERRRVTASAD